MTTHNVSKSDRESLFGQATSDLRIMMPRDLGFGPLVFVRRIIWERCRAIAYRTVKVLAYCSIPILASRAVLTADSHRRTLIPLGSHASLFWIKDYS